MAKTKKTQSEDAAAVASIQTQSSKDSARGSKDTSVSFESRNPRSVKEKTKKRSSASKSGLVFPPTRFRNKMKNAKFADHIGTGAGVYCAAAIEYLVAEIVELAGNAARDFQRKVIKPRHIQLAIGNDDELKKLLGDVIISEGGVMPSINPVLLPSRSPLHLARDKLADVLANKDNVQKKGGKKASKKTKVDKKKVVAKEEAVETETETETDVEKANNRSDDEEDVEMNESSAVTLPADEKN